MTHETFTSEDGLKLEGEVDLPDDHRAALLICHAHPGMQGTMNSPLLLALRDEAVKRRIAVLRFNFRGVGTSEGTFGTGVDEVADAAGALTHLRARAGDVPHAVAGWSFGGAVAVRLAARRRDNLACCIAIAPSTEEKAGISAGLPPASELGISVPLLVVVGSNDEHTPPERCRPWAEDAGARYIEIKAANHFFWARYERVAGAVADFLDEHLGASNDRR